MVLSEVWWRKILLERSTGLINLEIKWLKGKEMWGLLRNSSGDIGESSGGVEA